MLESVNLSKKYYDKQILSDINCKFEPGNIYGLIGINGAGKSTFLRHLCGVISPDTGVVLLDSSKLYENPNAKQSVIFLSDSPYIPSGYRMSDLKELYKTIYDNFDEQVYLNLSKLFNLSERDKINTFSKGMKKQALLQMALSARPQYILLDETFEGLDPLIRRKVKKIILELVAEKELCIIVSSHNLSDLENMCNYMFLIEGQHLKVLKDSEVTSSYVKVQTHFKSDVVRDDLIELEIVDYSVLGSVTTIVTKLDESKVLEVMSRFDTSFVDIINLTVEETFYYEVDDNKYMWAE